MEEDMNYLLHMHWPRDAKNPEAISFEADSDIDAIAKALKLRKRKILKYGDQPRVSQLFREIPWP